MGCLIETLRLILRGMEPTDLDFLCGMFASEETMQYLFGGVPMGREKALEFIGRHFVFGAEPAGLASLCSKETGERIGFGGIVPCGHLSEDDYEFGSALVKSARGRGFAVEIGGARIHYGFRHLGCSRMLALVHPMNEPSKAVLKRLGMRFYGEVPLPDRGPREIHILKEANGSQPHPPSRPRPSNKHRPKVSDLAVMSPPFSFPRRREFAKRVHPRRMPAVADMTP